MDVECDGFLVNDRGIMITKGLPHKEDVPEVIGLNVLKNIPTYVKLLKQTITQDSTKVNFYECWC